LLGGGVCGGWQFCTQPQLRPIKQGESGSAVKAPAGPGDQPAVKTSADTQAQSTAAVLACPFPTTVNCSYFLWDAQNTRRTPTHLQGLTQLDHLPPSQIHRPPQLSQLGTKVFRDSAGRARVREEEQGVAHRRHCPAERYAVDCSFEYNRS
jgi:hypothetical protein